MDTQKQTSHEKLISQAMACGASMQGNKLVFNVEGLALFKVELMRTKEHKVDTPAVAKSILLIEANSDCC